jgi:hypothetical protein
MLFIKKEIRGVSFMDATGIIFLDISGKAEKEAAKLERRVCQFGHL